ncbi:hypothetical protein BCF33_2500 [Hasllibacter halocynthiae]|uniref:YcxB-like protein n=1 Tax=Hasllibacter halocynthiae TaxID=595589 RepID=A0A2T0X3W0_9RHOB|nr:hypothetical protein [Hasllibacter halocynthiae]PRY93620.1 hypothetical protein BCF33_2500 [Hasllibacter halocynthiae]
MDEAVEDRFQTPRGDLHAAMVVAGRQASDRRLHAIFLLAVPLSVLALAGAVGMGSRLGSDDMPLWSILAVALLCCVPLWRVVAPPGRVMAGRLVRTPRLAREQGFRADPRVMEVASGGSLFRAGWDAVDGVILTRRILAISSGGVVLWVPRRVLADPVTARDWLLRWWRA